MRSRQGSVAASADIATRISSVTSSRPGWFGSYTWSVIESTVSSYAYASTWWFLVRCHGDRPAVRMSPTTDGCPASISWRIRGHSRRSVSTRGGSRRMSAATPLGGSARSAWRSRYRRGTRNQSSDSTWRRTSARNRREPFEGGAASRGELSPASYRSRAVSAIPPHSPADASPNPTRRGSSPPRVSVGPGGNAFENRSPWIDGRKPGTAFDVMPPVTGARLRVRRRRQLVGQHRGELARVRRAVVRVAVVHENVRVLRAARRLEDARDPLLELLAVVQVPEPLDGRAPLHVLPRRGPPTVEPHDRERRRGRGDDRRHRRLEPLRPVDHDERDALVGEEAQGALDVLLVEPGGVPELDGDGQPVRVERGLRLADRVPILGRGEEPLGVLEEDRAQLAALGEG